jgi:type VI secretion system protein ImpL
MNLLRQAWAPAGGVFSLFMLLGISMPRWLSLSTGELWFLRIGLWLLGLAAAVLLFLHLRARARNRPRPDDELDAAFTAARKRLAAAGASGRIGKLPVVLVVGHHGSAKTTSIVRSGLNPELLAGEVWRGDEIVSTPAVNVWYGSGAVWVEAGGRLLGEEARWHRLLRHLRPARAAAVLSRGVQQPRVAVVCVGCDEFLKPNAAEGVVATAQRLRARLVDAAQQLGIRLPVYVVFTKADRLPHFLDFVRSLTADEAEQVLGATLPVAPQLDAATYGEGEGARLQLAFNRILQSLGLRRAELLRRESDEDIRAGVYEFPRELAKVAPLATRFLLDLCRPGQLGSSPFLRGFYFTGVRPLVLAAAPAAPQAPPLRSPTNATTFFGARAHVAASQAPQQPGGRRVPQWTFLPRIFHHVISRDRVAMGVTGGGARVDMMRRTLAGAALAALVLLCVGLTVSFFQNRGLIRATKASVVAARPAAMGGGTGYELSRLDSLRATAAQLRAWNIGAPPRRMRFGLYTGNRMLPDVRTYYFRAFELALWNRTRADLATSLDALPLQPPESIDYQLAYEALRAYLVTTEYPEHSSSHALTPVLLGHWARDAGTDSAAVLVAERHIDFFADELPFGNPYVDRADAGRVQLMREYLAGFSNEDQFYRTLLAGAVGAGAVPMDFHRSVPGADVAVRSPVVVPAAFTKKGWEYVQSSLQDISALFEREQWVLGDRVMPRTERERLAHEIRGRYVADYITAWSRFLSEATVLPFGGLADAVRKLDGIAGYQSYLLQLLDVAATNTDIDNEQVRAAFQPLHAVMPPEVTGQFVRDANRGYVESLNRLRIAYSDAQLATGGARTAPLGMAAGDVRQQVAGLSQRFSLDGGARPVADAVQRLLITPVGGTEEIARSGPAQEANSRGAAFCRDLAPVLRKFPFDRRASAEARPDEVAQMFQPGSSRLATFEAEDLAGIVAAQGPRYGQASGSEVQVSREFLQFLGRTRDISRALYAADGSGPAVPFSIRLHLPQQVSAASITVGGRRQEWTEQSRGLRSYQWEAARAGASIEAVVAGNRVTLAQETGMWGIARLLHAARWQEVRPNEYQLTWTFPQHQLELRADVMFERNIPIFKPDYFSGFACVSRVAN